MGTVSWGGSRLVIAVALTFGAAGALGVGCFPSYIYDGNLGAGGAGSASSAAVTSMTTASTGSMGGTSTTTGTAGGTPASSSTGGPPPCSEMDCSNPSCKASFTCVPMTPPTGWTGYFALYDGVPSALPGCTGTWPTQSYEGSAKLTADPASCPCTCGTPSGGTCDIPELDISDAACTVQGVCTGPVTPPAGYMAGKCFNFPDAVSGFDEFGGATCGPQQPGVMNCTSGTQICNVSAAVGPGTVSGSTCAPSATAPDLPQVTWGATGQACTGATPGTGCGSSDSCMPIPEGPFHAGVCIMQAGQQTCPSVQFTDPHVFFSGTTDTRGCTDCACGAATGDSCGVQWTLYSDGSTPPSCQTKVLTANSGQCTPFSGNPNVTSAKATVAVPPNGGMCTEVDGQPTGTATASGATTFCCIPAP
jgi:hypothetical protein